MKFKIRNKSEIVSYKNFQLQNMNLIQSGYNRSGIVLQYMIQEHMCLTHSVEGEGLSRSPANRGRAALEEEFSSEEETEL